MTRKAGKFGRALTLSSIVAAAPLVAACSSGPSYDQWAATDGAAGRINLDDVQQAFRDSKSATDFEDKVNQIYEGDGIILIRASQDGENLKMEGWEDLNNNSSIEDAQDDILFSITQGTNKEYNMRGHNANGHYNNSFGGGNFLFTYLLLSSFRGPGAYYYQTPVSRGSQIRQQRGSYRQSSRYSSQVARNSSYTRKQQSFSGSRYQQSRNNVSSNRQTYQSRQKTSGAFKSSSSVTRSSSRSSFSRSSGGRARGGGGAMTLLHGRSMGS